MKLRDEIESSFVFFFFLRWLKWIEGKTPCLQSPNLKPRPKSSGKGSSPTENSAQLEMCIVSYAFYCHVRNPMSFQVDKLELWVCFVFMFRDRFVILQDYYLPKIAFGKNSSNISVHYVYTFIWNILHNQFPNRIIYFIDKYLVLFCVWWLILLFSVLFKVLL